MKTNKRKLLLCGCILLVGIFVMFTALCFNSGVFPSDTSVYAVGQDGDGSGTESDPYLIGSSTVLNNSTMRGYFGTENKHFKLINDIDLGALTWTPIPTFAAGCVLDGNGKTINNLTISSSGAIGLFSRVNGGTIKDLKLKDINITGVTGSVTSNHTGSIAGIVSGTTTCTNVYVEGGTIKNTGGRTGGLFGQITSSANLVIDKCYIKAEINNTGNSTGGFLGLYENGSGSGNTITIANSYHIGAIAGNNNIAGGIMGGISTGSTGFTVTVTIENCFHTGKVTSNGIMTAGIIAYTNSTGSTVNIINCYSSATLSGTTANKIGGLYGGRDSGTAIVNITNSYYDSTLYTGSINGTAVPASEIKKDTLSGGKSTADMQTQDFAALLGDAFIFDSNGYPTLKVFGNTQTVTFDYNYDGASASVDVIKALDEKITDADIPEPLRIGYEFKGWNTQLDGSGTTYNYNNGILINENDLENLAGTTLYAQWEVIEYTLIIQTQGGNASFKDGINKVTIENKNAIIEASGANFAYWQVWDSAKANGAGDWATLYDYPEKENVLNISAIFDEAFISSYAYKEVDGMKIKIQAVFAETVKVTVRSNQQSFGLVKLNGDDVSYNSAKIVEKGVNVKIDAQAKDYYRFLKYTIDGNDEFVSDNSFNFIKDTTVYVTFEREEDYNLSISSQYLSGELIPDSEELVDLSNKKFKIGDKIQIYYDTNKSGFNFSALYAVKNDGLIYPLDTGTGVKGVLRLEITEELLNQCLNLIDKKLEIIAVYSKQYEFLIKFQDSRMSDYCEIEISVEGTSGFNYYSLDTVYYFDEGTIVLIKIKNLDGGHKILPVEGLTETEFATLFSSNNLEITLDSGHSIIMTLETRAYNIALDAKDKNGNSIQGVVFNAGEAVTLGYNGQTKAIEKTDVSGYRFLGWQIFNNQSKEWDELNAQYIDSSKNLISINYSYFANNYINENDEIKIAANYIQVFTFTLNVGGTGSYKVYVNDVEKNTNSDQFDYGTKIEIKVNESAYINFKGFIKNNELQSILEKDGEYVLTITSMDSDCIVSFDFEPIQKTFNITEKLSNAKGVMNFETSGTKDGDVVNAKVNDTITFTFDLQSGYKLKEWSFNGLTVSEMVEDGYAVYNGNVLTLNLTEKTLNWLNNNKMNIDVSVETIFNPLFTAGIIAAAILIPLLVIFIALYMQANKKKKKQIEAAVAAGIIGSARFKSNLVDDAINAEAVKIENDDNNNNKI